MKKKEIITRVTEYDSLEELANEDQILVQKSKEAALGAYAPYSHFHVGAAVKLDNGEIVIGNNQENAAYPSGLCAERVAIFHANAQYPDVAVTAIAISVYYNSNYISTPVPPCGSCRQVLLETENRYGRPIKVILAGEKLIQIIENARALLPINFDEKFLSL